MNSGIMKSVMDLKRSQLELLAQHRDQLRKSPHLRWLFFEITDKCNLKCLHCGSNCSAEGLCLTVDDICACLDIVNKSELAQGNIHSDDFMDVWLHRFEAFRRDRTADCLQCIACPERNLCGGDSAHTWNYNRKMPLFCYQDFQSFLK